MPGLVLLALACGVAARETPCPGLADLDGGTLNFLSSVEIRTVLRACSTFADFERRSPLHSPLAPALSMHRPAVLAHLTPSSASAARAR